jgi:membrane associated rhomboid family serine protease
MRFSAVKALIGANVAVFLLQMAAPDVLEYQFALWPLASIEGSSHFRLWQLLTYAFLHGGLAHLAFNMFGVWMFGSEIERYAGPRRLLACYFASVATAGITQLFVPLMFGAELSRTIGASGGVFGLLLAFAVMFPTRRLMLLFPPIPMPAWVFATLYALLELVLGVTGRQADVAHFAHLGGMIGGGIVLSTWLRRRV